MERSASNYQGSLLDHGQPDLCLEEDSITFVNGRLPHCGKGRTKAQGSHIVMHVFVRVCSPSTVCWESLSLQQQEDLWRTLPDIVERGGLMDNIDWPKAGKYLDCPRCRLRRPAFRCGKCECSGVLLGVHSDKFVLRV